MIYSILPEELRSWINSRAFPGDYAYSIDANTGQSLIYFYIGPDENPYWRVMLPNSATEIESEIIALCNESVGNNFGGCNGCKHIPFRYPYPSMYPCNKCIRAGMKDYYNVDLKD